MKKGIQIVMLFLVSCNANAQVKDAVKNLKAQATKMGTAFVTSDYKTFAKYTNPKIVDMMGGTTKMTTAMEGLIASFHKQGMTFTSVDVEEPSPLIKEGAELQATIVQHTHITTPKGKLNNSSTLIAISGDNGEHWTFLDTSNKDMTTIRKVLPHLSQGIHVLPQQAPVQE